MAAVRLQGVAGHARAGTASVVWSLAGFATAAAQQAPAASPSPVTERAATILIEGESRVFQAWRGYWPPGQPFLLAEPGRGVLLYSVRPPPVGYQPLSDLTNLPPAAVGRVYWLSGDAPDLAASRGHMDIEYAVSGEAATAVSVQDTDTSTVQFLYHESFHRFQNQHFAPPLSVDQRFDVELISTPEYDALAEVERRMLRTALEGTHDGSPADFLRRYLAVRQYRIQSLPERVQAVERHLERMEGSAEYVGRRALHLALSRPLARLSAALADELAEPLVTPSFGGGAQWRERARVYATGAAIGVLLDRLGVDWKPALQGGMPFDALLGDAVEFVPTAADSLVADPLRDFGYDDLVRAFRSRARGGGR